MTLITVKMINDKNLILFSSRLRKPILIAFLMAFVFVLVQPANAQQAGANSTFRLIGTIRGKLFSGAVLQDTTGNQVVYQLHEKLPDGSRIVHLREDSIALKGEDGTVYDMYIAHDTRSVESSSGSSGSKVVQPVSRTPQQQESLARKEQRMSRRAHRRSHDDDE